MLEGKKHYRSRHYFVKDYASPIGELPAGLDLSKYTQEEIQAEFGEFFYNQADRSRKIINEFIAYRIYAALGVHVPKAYILTEVDPVTGNKYPAALATRRIDNCIELSDVLPKQSEVMALRTDGLGGEQEVDVQVIMKEVFKDGKRDLVVNGKTMQIKNLFETVLAGLLPMDHDVVGPNFGNIVFVKKDDNLHAVKIDPAESELGIALEYDAGVRKAGVLAREHINPNLSAENVLQGDVENTLYNPFVGKNAQLVNLLKYATEAEKREAFYRIIKAKAAIKKIFDEKVFSDAAITEYVNREKQQQITAELLARLEMFEQLFADQLQTYPSERKQTEYAQTKVKPRKQHKVLHPLSDFRPVERRHSENTDAQINNSLSKPKFQRKISKAEKYNPQYKQKQRFHKQRAKSNTTVGLPIFGIGLAIAIPSAILLPYVLPVVATIVVTAIGVGVATVGAIFAIGAIVAGVKSLIAKKKIRPEPKSAENQFRVDEVRLEPGAEPVIKRTQSMRDFRLLSQDAVKPKPKFSSAPARIGAETARRAAALGVDMPERPTTVHSSSPVAIPLRGAATIDVPPSARAQSVMVTRDELCSAEANPAVDDSGTAPLVKVR